MQMPYIFISKQFRKYDLFCEYCTHRQDVYLTKRLNRWMCDNCREFNEVEIVEIPESIQILCDIVDNFITPFGSLEYKFIGHEIEIVFCWDAKGNEEPLYANKVFTAYYLVEIQSNIVEKLFYDIRYLFYNIIQEYISKSYQTYTLIADALAEIRGK